MSLSGVKRHDANTANWSLLTRSADSQPSITALQKISFDHLVGRGEYRLRDGEA